MERTGRTVKCLSIVILASAAILSLLLVVSSLTASVQAQTTVFFLVPAGTLASTTLEDNIIVRSDVVSSVNIGACNLPFGTGAVQKAILLSHGEPATMIEVITSGPQGSFHQGTTITDLISQGNCGNFDSYVGTVLEHP